MNHTRKIPLFLIAMAGAVLALAALPAPTYAESADFTISDAQYVWDDNTLILNFTGRVNIWNMDVSNISITDGVCALAFTWRDYDAVSSDRMSITVKPNEIQRESLAGMAEPRIQFRNDSFHEASTNMGMVPVEIPLRTVGDPPYHDPKCVITYGYHDGLLKSYAHDYNQTSQAVHDGLSAWSDLNPYLEFVWVERDPLVWIEWVDYTPEYIGLACLWCLHNDPAMEIALYGYDCRGGRIYHDPNSVRNTVAHELGHILGLNHHTNTTHLMYGPAYQVDPYETHGYVVPDNLEGHFVGEAELYNQTMTLRAELDRLNTQLERLEARGDRDGNTIYFETQSQANQFNRLVAKYNETVGEYNMTVDELNCMYEARDPWHSDVPDLSDLEITPP